MISRKTKDAFGLLELVVSVSIVAILATASLVTLSRVRRQARDSARVSDVTQIQSALSAYQRDYDDYPVAITPNIEFSVSSTVYMTKVPSYITPIDSGCSNSSSYNYQRTSATSYFIEFCLSTSVGDLPAGINFATPGGFYR